MRAARLLHCLLLLQNRGRMTSVQLAQELEVSPRTILRDVDAMTEAGLPVIVHQGNQGGIELGFNYRTRLTGLAREEAEALGILLSRPCPELDTIGLGTAARMASSKMLESLPDTVREHALQSAERIALMPQSAGEPDPRVAPMADAVRQRQVVRLNARSAHPRKIHPIRLELDGQQCRVVDQASPHSPIPLCEWGDINISALRFKP